MFKYYTSYLGRDWTEIIITDTKIGGFFPL